MSWVVVNKILPPPEKCKINANNCYLCAIEKFKNYLL